MKSRVSGLILISTMLLSIVLAGCSNSIVDTSPTTAPITPQSSVVTNSPEPTPSPSVEPTPSPAIVQREINEDDMTFSGMTLLKTTIEEAKEMLTDDLSRNDYGDSVTFSNNAGVEYYFRKQPPDDELRFYFLRVIGDDIDITGPRGLKAGMDVRDFLATLPIGSFDIEKLTGDGSTYVSKMLYDNGVVAVKERQVSIPPSAVCVLHPPLYTSGNIVIAYPQNEITPEQLMLHDERDMDMFRIWISFDDYKVNYFAVYYGRILED